MKQNILFETNVIHRIYDQPRRIHDMYDFATSGFSHF